MEELKEIFVKDGITHTLVSCYLDEGWINEKGSVGVGLYELSLPDRVLCGYSVIEFEHRKNRFDGDKSYVGLAGSESWGSKGWSYMTLCGGRKRYQEREEYLRSKKEGTN